MNIIKKLPRLLWLNILWLVCCIPVLTVGASTCAAYAVTLRLADDDEEVTTIGGITRRFFKAFRQDLLQGFLILIFTLVFIFYSYPLIARYSNSFVNTLRNSVALFAQYPNQSVKTLAIVIVELGLLYLSRYIYFAAFIILPAIIFYTVSVTAKDIFVKLENPPVPEEEEAPETDSEPESDSDSSEES